jgi:hypothetical protein
VAEMEAGAEKSLDDRSKTEGNSAVQKTVPIISVSTPGHKKPKQSRVK